MTNPLKILIPIFLLLSLGNIGFSQARLTIENDSQRRMTVKVMESNYGADELYNTVYIQPYQSKTIYFSTTGHYYTKTKAELSGSETIYRKGDPFRVYNGTDGYSVMTLTFTIKETNIPQASGGKSISKKEFEQD